MGAYRADRPPRRYGCVCGPYSEETGYPHWPSLPRLNCGWGGIEFAPNLPGALDFPPQVLHQPNMYRVVLYEGFVVVKTELLSRTDRPTTWHPALETDTEK